MRYKKAKDVDNIKVAWPATSLLAEHFTVIIARLLQETQSRGLFPDYTTMLLDAIGEDIFIPTISEGALPEPLTQREEEVLELLAAGVT